MWYTFVFSVNEHDQHSLPCHVTAAVLIVCVMETRHISSQDVTTCVGVKATVLLKNSIGLMTCTVCSVSFLMYKLITGSLSWTIHLSAVTPAHWCSYNCSLLKCPCRNTCGCRRHQKTLLLSFIVTSYWFFFHNCCYRHKLGSSKKSTV